MGPHRNARLVTGGGLLIFGCGKRPHVIGKHSMRSTTSTSCARFARAWCGVAAHRCVLQRAAKGGRVEEGGKHAGNQNGTRRGRQMLNRLTDVERQKLTIKSAKARSHADLVKCMPATFPCPSATQFKSMMIVRDTCWGFSGSYSNTTSSVSVLCDGVL
jgi:hypothetical protein